MRDIEKYTQSCVGDGFELIMCVVSAKDTHGTEKTAISPPPKKWRVSRFSREYYLLWNEFVLRAKNGHFFFQRDYMEYHADRFIDYSLMFFDDRDRLLALLPASKSGTSFISHGGLTFGGFLVDDRMTTGIMLELFEQLKIYLKERDFSEIIYKCIPYIYHQYPAEEDIYALFCNGAELVRRDVSTAVYLPERYKFQEQRARAVKRARKNNLTVQCSTRYEEYIQLLDDVLSKYHQAHPVHTGKELRLLAERFPDNIKLFTAEAEGEILAGTVVFVNKQTVHTQYLANSDKGRKIGALDLVIDYLINNVYADFIYFDFGISNENDGMYLNEGLIAQKEGFGARAVVHDFYRIVL